jgi:hypothetical protein
MKQIAWLYMGAPEALPLFKMGNVQFHGRGQGYKDLRSSS